MFVSKLNEMYVCEYLNHVVRRVSSSGVSSIIAGTGSGDNNGCSGLATRTTLYNPRCVTGVNPSEGDGGLAVDASLHGPTGIFVTPSHEVYISEHFGYRIRKINSCGVISTLVGDGTKGYAGDVPFDFKRHPHVGPRKKQLIFPKSYFDISIIAYE